MGLSREQSLVAASLILGVALVIGAFVSSRPAYHT